MVFLFICILLLLNIIVFLLLKIRIQIDNFKFSSIYSKRINKDYKLIIKLFILKDIPILNLQIDKTQLEKIKVNEKFKRVKIKILENNVDFNKETLKLIPKIDLKIDNINLKVEIGTENVVFTSMLVPVISTIVTILLSRTSRKKCKYKL